MFNKHKSRHKKGMEKKQENNLKMARWSTFKQTILIIILNFKRPNHSHWNEVFNTRKKRQDPIYMWNNLNCMTLLAWK